MAKPRENTNHGSSVMQVIAWDGSEHPDFDILENGPGGSEGCEYGVCSKALLVASPAGALVYVDRHGNTVTVPQAVLTAQPLLPVQAQRLVSDGSANAIVMVLW